MAASDKKILMGYDPLAWLGQEPEEEVIVESLPNNIEEEFAPDSESVFGTVQVEESIVSAEAQIAASIDNIEIGNETIVPDTVDMIDLVSRDDSYDQLEVNTTTIEADMNEISENPSDLLSVDTNDDVDIESVITLDSMLTIQGVGKLYDKIKKSYSAHSSIEINAAQVSSIDTSTLQLLVALKKDAVKKQKIVVFAEPSNRFIESAELLGLVDLLSLEV